MVKQWPEKPSTEPLDQLFSRVLNGSIDLHDPRFVGHQINPPAPAAALASLVVDLLNNGMGIYEMGMAGTAMERAVMRELAQQFGFDDQAAGFLTSGGTLGNLTALLTARAVHLSKRSTKAPFSVLVSEEAHYCIERAALVMGWGKEGVIQIPSDERFCMRVELLDSAYEQAKKVGREVIAVVGSACSTSTGSYDDLEAIASFCQARNVWFHVDGAHGAAVIFSKKYRHLLRGINQADSIVLDFHKMLLSPALATAVLFRRGGDGYHTFVPQAEYLWTRDGTEEWFNIAKRTFECTKSMMVLKFYVLLSQYGTRLFDAAVTRMHDLAKEFANLIRQRSQFELAVEPTSNIVCFQLRKSSELNAAVRKALIEQGELYVVQTNLRGETWLRCTFSNPFTTTEIMRRVLDEVERLGTVLQQ